MLIRILFFFVAGLLKLRYRIRLHGLETIPRKNAKGILFLPNHPAMVDPPIVGSVLVPRFRPWILVNAAQVQATVLKYAVNCLKLLPVPDVGVFGRDAMALVEKKITACAEALDRGENVLIYPAGHTYHCRYEDLKGNMGVHLLLKQCPDTRVVLLRTVGLWGSSFSKSSGGDPEFRDTILANIRHLLENLIFFGPRRHVDITFYEASDIPRSGTKEELNRYLENFYNQVAPGNTYVPYTWWERGGVRVLPEPTGDEEADVSCVPPEIREKVLAKLRETASVNEVNDRDLLGADLGMDSLMIYELSVWIQQEFGENVSSPDTLRRAEDVMLGAMGLKKTRLTLNPVPPEWFQPPNDAIVKIPEGCGKITETFLYWAARNPDYPILADQTVGILSNRKIILVIMVLQKTFAGLPGERVGIIMPACAPFFLIYMALLFAGKTPVLLNWTSGSRNMASCVRKAGLQATISSKRVITELESRGIDFSGIRETILHGMPEDVRRKKLSARAVRMAQSGQYNYSRCIRHGEPGAAQLAADEFVRNAAEMIFLLNRAHAPYYKWLFRKMATLEKLSGLRYALEFILTGENDPGLKTGVIEDVCAQIIKELTLQGLTDSPSDYLEPHAYEIQERIQNREIRALHIMEG